MRLALLLLALLLPATAAARDVTAAIVYFNNEGNDELKMLRLGLAEMLIVGVANAEGVTVVERSRINEVLAELELQSSDAIDQSTAVAVGRGLAVDKVVFGGYLEVLGQFVVTARVVDIETGKVDGGSKLAGTVADFSSMVDQLAAELPPVLRGDGDDGANGTTGGTGSTGSTGVTRGSSDPPATTPTPAPSATPEPTAEATPAPTAEPTPTEAAPATPTDPMGAALAFSEGLDYLDRKDLKRARESLRRAIDLDPSLDPARTALAGINI